MRKVRSRAAAAAVSLVSVLGFSAVSSGYGHHGADEVVVAAPTTYVSPTSYVALPTTYVSPTSYVSTSYVATARVVPSSYTYYTPTSYSYAVPTSTSYVVPTSTSYVVPTSTSYVVPTSTSYVVPTSYSLSPTTYYATSYRRGLLSRLFSRPVIETTKVYSYDPTPTSYYLPTTISLDAPVVSTGYALACNESAVPFVPPSAPVASSSPDPASKSVTSKPRSEPDPTYTEPVPKPRTATPKAAATEASPPAVEQLQRPKDPQNDLTLPPVEEPPAVEPQSSSTSFRPKATELKPREGSAAPNMLRGEIVSGLTGKPLDGMQVVLSDPNHKYQDRVKTTDAQGGFEIFLPEGDWTLRVVDPNAPPGTKPKEYGMVTATGGRYLDESANPIYGLRISN